MTTMKPSPTRSVKLADCQGQPALFVNGEPRFLAAPYLHKAPYEQFAETAPGVWMLFDHAFDVSPEGEPDTSAIEKDMDALLARDPEALVIARSAPPDPQWWLDAHPDDVMQFDHDVSRLPDAGRYRTASWGSDRWLEAMLGWYRAWCEQLHRRYDGRIIGHQFGMGASHENRPLGACAADGRWFCSDFSPAMRDCFRRWLRATYPDDDALRAAWGRSDVTLATAGIPDRVERLRSDWFTFRSPRRSQSADYYRCFSERIEHIVIRVCETIKAATGGNCLAGSHLGALMDDGFHGYLYHQSTTSMTRRAMAHPAVDLFTSPPSYWNRDPGGDATSMMVAGSLGLHGKLIFQDQDSRTAVLPPGYREAFTLGNIAADLDESVGILKRDAGMVITRGYGLWWHPIVRGMYDHPDLARCIARLHHIGRQSLNHPRGVAEGVAMIVDEESAFYQQCSNHLFYPMLYAQRQQDWGRGGVPWNVYLHNDLDHPRMPDHRVYYFLNTFYLTDDEIRRIEAKVKRNGATVIWSIAPGIQSPAGIDLARVERLTGFRLCAAEIEALPRITLTALDHPYARDVRPLGDAYEGGKAPPGFFGVGPMGNDEHEGAIGPLIYVDDPEAVTVGELDPLQAPGFCVKPMDGWTSVFVAAPRLNAHVLRNIARAAGVHVYAEDGDVILPGKSYLTLHARTAGEKHVRLPEARDVYECYDGRLIGNDVTEFRDTLARHATGFYFLGKPGAPAWPLTSSHAQPVADGEPSIPAFLSS